MPGPVPKRSDQRRRRNTDGGEVDRVEISGDEVRGPELDLPDVHPLAADWYESLRTSGQAVYYEPSDWAQARIWAELISRALNQGAKPSAVLIAAWSTGAGELMTTEGARRRLRLELERSGTVDADEEASVTALAEYQRRLSG